jgi:hypothetical protein
MQILKTQVYNWMALATQPSQLSLVIDTWSVSREEQKARSLRFLPIQETYIIDDLTCIRLLAILILNFQKKTGISLAVEYNQVGIAALSAYDEFPICLSA